MKLPKNCIVCGSSTNLDTSMNIKYHGQMHEIWLCTEHDETTAKQAKEELKTILDRIDELCEEAEKYGMVVIPKEEYKELEGAHTLQAIRTGNVTVQQAVAPSSARKVKTASNVVGGESLEGYDSYDTQVRAGEITEDVVTIDGETTNVPSVKTADGSSIKIIKTADDSFIQSRTKQVNEGTKNPAYGGVKYSSECSACRGTGNNPITKTACPKCKGSGIRT